MTDRKIIKGKLVPAFLLMFLFAGAEASFSDHHVPEEAGVPAGSVTLDLSPRSALIADAGRFDLLLEIQGRFAGPSFSFPYASLTAGSYFRVHKNLKIGLFYKLQQGARHDDDWIWENGEWLWADSFGRFEHLLLADVSPRFLLPFLPGENWVFSTKLRYIFNTFNLHHSLYARPGLTFYLMYNREPIVNIGLHYGFYIPFNFSESFIYEHEPYLNLLFHPTRFLKLEATFSFRSVIWTSSEDSIELGQDPYRIPERSFVIGFGVLFLLG